MANMAHELGVPVIEATEKQLERRKINLDKDAVAVGSVPFVRSALGQLGICLPMHTPYPPELEGILRRRVAKVRSLREAKAMLEIRGRLFIKPADGWKRFTGFVAEFGDDYRFSGASGSKPVWVSDPVHFVSEWRAYVVEGEIRELRYADHGGDRGREPDLSIITAAVATLTAAARGPKGYVIDFGVLENGETALIEMNDGFSFGAYDGVKPSTYWDVTVNRWQELTSQIKRD